MERWGPLSVEAPTVPLTWRVLNNPVTGTARFGFSASLPENALLEIYDVRGRLVHEGRLQAGDREVAWNGRTGAGTLAPPGIYFARVRGASLEPVRLVRLP